MTKIIFKSLDKKTLVIYLFFIKYLLKKFNITPISTVHLPTAKRRITLLKSPHVNKKAQEQFEIKVFSKAIIIKNCFKKNIIKYILINKPKNLKLKFFFSSFKKHFS